MLLSDQYFNDENGHSVQAHEIKSLATYKYISDGFFNWECPCGKQHSSRAYRIAGVVFTCPDCKRASLLVRTDFQYVNQILSQVEQHKMPHEERIRKAIASIGKALTDLTT